MVERVHPEIEELTAYANNPKDRALEDVRSHVEDCPDCLQKVESERRLIEKLKLPETIGIIPEGTDHLSDDVMSAYVFGEVSEEQGRNIENHLAQCGDCMREVMLMRAHINQRQQAEKKTVHSTVTDLPSKNKRKPRFSLLVLPVAAAIVLSAMVFKWWTVSEDVIIQPDQLTTTHNQNNGGFQKVGNRIDWYKNYMETTAVGTADMEKAKNKVHAEMLAEYTARLIAYSQLAEIAGGVKITKNVVLKDLLIDTDLQQFENQAFIKGAKVVSKSVQWENDVPKATVTLRAPLFGKTSLDEFIRSNLPEEKYTPESLTPMQLTNEDKLMQDQVGEITGIVIKASGYEPAMITRVVSTDNRQVLVGPGPQDKIRFFPSIDQAQAHGGKVMIINAVNDAAAAGTIVVDKLDAIKMSLWREVHGGPRNYAVVF